MQFNKHRASKRTLLTALLALAIAASLAAAIAAQDSATISGRVVDPEGNPAPGLAVHLCELARSNCLTSETGADGRFEFNPSQGSYRIALHDPLSGRRLHYLDGGDGNLSWDPDDHTQLDVAESTLPAVRITLPSATQVAGVARRSNGNPLAGADIVLCDTRTLSCQVGATDAQGRFSFTAPRDDYVMLINLTDPFVVGHYNPQSPGSFEEGESSGTLQVRATPLTNLEIVLPARIDEVPHEVSGRLTYTEGTPVAGARVLACRVSNQACASVQTDASGNFQLSLTVDGSGYDLRFDWLGSIGYYSADWSGSYTASRNAKTVLTPDSGSIDGLEISIPLPNQVSGPIRWPNGDPASGTTVTVCRDLPELSCSSDGVRLSTETRADGRFAIDVPRGEHYVAFTIKSNERWYYHRDSAGRLINTGRRPERTFVIVPSAEAVDLQVRIPQREVVEILISDPHPQSTHKIGVKVEACREGWTFDSFLPWCLFPTEDQHLVTGVRRVGSPIPDERFYFRLSLDGYATRSNAYWYYDRDSASGLSTDFTRADIYSAENPPSARLRLILPDLPRTVPVALQLNPGVNLVGWPGGTISLADLARQLPALKGVVSIPRHDSIISQAYPVGMPDAPDLATGSLWWFYVALDEPTTIEIETPVDQDPYGTYGRLIRGGASLLVWTDTKAASLEQATAGLGRLNSAPRLLRWNGASLDDADSGTVRQGDVILIDSPRQIHAQLPTPEQPFFVLQGPPDEHWQRLERRFADVQSFFWEQYGVRRNDVTVYYRTAIDDDRLINVPEGQCGSAWTRITLVCGESHAIAKYYFRFLQWNMSYILNHPGWLIEGAMEYAAARYRHHAQERSGDPLASYRLAARNDTEEHRTLRQLPFAIQYWGDDPSATRLAALAVDWLVRHSGDPDALFDVFRRVSDYYLTDERNDHDWPRAFEEAFGIAVDDFYDRFAEYRANGFRPVGG